MVASQLYGVEPTDPLTYAAVSVVLVVSAVLASFVPARCAASMNPPEALKESDRGGRLTVGALAAAIASAPAVASIAPDTRAHLRDFGP